MIRSFYGLSQDPFDLRDIELLPGQQEIYDTLTVHCQQGGLCLVLGVPGTGKSVIKQALRGLPDNRHLVATVARTLHTYTNTIKILCDAFRIEHDSNAFKCERRLIEQAFSLNHAGKCLTTIMDDAHLMDLANLRKLRLLFEDFPKNHNLILIGRPNLLAALDMGVNHDIKSRVTYSVITKRLATDDMREFPFRQESRLAQSQNKELLPFVIGGFEEGGTDTGFELHLGYYDGDGDLVHAGKAGLGYTFNELIELRDKLVPAAKCPFAGKRKKKANVTWVEPQLVAIIEQGAWTGAGFLCEAVYRGLRQDIRPSDVVVD